jgi:hypothetical protein
VRAQEGPPASRLERILASMVVATVGLSIASFFAIIIATWQGFDRGDFGQGIWPIITMIPLIGLPAGFLLILALLLVSTRRRRQGWSSDDER